MPKIWDIFKKGVEEKLGKGSPVARYLFEVAFVGRACALRQGALLRADSRRIGLRE